MLGRELREPAIRIGFLQGGEDDILGNGMRRFLLYIGCTGVVIACGPPLGGVGPNPVGVSNGEAFEGVQCSAVRPQTEPDLMAWDSGSRLNLKRLRTKGVVVVRYEANGCDVKLELLSNCIAPGSYEYTSYSANERKVAHSASELYAQLPLGAANLTGKVKGNRALRTDYALVGQYALPPAAIFKSSELQGPGCERATHVVSSVYVGGFALVSGDGRELDAAVTVFGAGGGGKTEVSVERLADEGKADACAKAQEEQTPNSACDVPLRIGLLALNGAGTRSLSTGTNKDSNLPVTTTVVPTATAAPTTPASPPTSPPATSAAPSTKVVYNTPTKINSVGSVDFNSAGSVINPKSYAFLQEVVDVLKGHPEIIRLVIEGHTDNVGNASANLKLSQDRATAVLRWLTDHGIDPKRLEAQGFGQNLPIASNDTAAGRAKNRRIEFKVIQK